VPEKKEGIRSVAYIGRFLLGLGLALFCGAFTPRVMTGVAHAESGQSTGRNDFQALTGRWLRPDGGYVLELRNIQKDGSLKAAYFNPRSINVSRAKLHRKDGKITLVVELRDVNYPGSLYTLQYDPGNDRLAGIYFQAVQGETFDVVFVRIK
jgi:hypothetical protein